MIDLLSKPADQIDIPDIKSLIDSEVPEGEQIEFKENLSTKGAITKHQLQAFRQVRASLNRQDSSSNRRFPFGLTHT